MRKRKTVFSPKNPLNLLILLLVLKLTREQCGKGCLKCTSEDKCLLCDTTESYRLENHQCTEHNPTNCKAISLEGECLQCSSGYYLNPTEKTCQQVDTAKEKSKCTKYDSSMNCAECKRDYYVNSGNCVAVSTLIKNCEINQTDKLCKECEKNYLLSLDRKSCIQKTQIANCQYWSTVTCERCGEGYIKNRNLYFLEWYALETSKQKADLLERVYKLKFGYSEMEKHNVCQEIEISNCVEYQDFQRCKICEADFFLDEEKKCQGYPKEKIKNCQIYDSASNCTECVQGYFLKNNVCEQVVEIANCAKYDPQESSSKCIECAADYILSGTTCTKRQSSDGSNIANCKTKHLTEDKCETCQENYVISTDGLKCFAAVSNCLEHAQVGSTSQNFSCKVCNDDYFLNDQTCETGSVSNCKVFTAITTCKECESQYYLANEQTCSKSNDIANCELYDGTTEKAHHTCRRCTNNTFNFTIEKYCKDIDSIPNCKAYKRDATTATCDQCNPGFFKVSDTTCNAFNDTNCTSGTAVNVCTHCNAHFALDTSSSPDTCRTPHEHVIANCGLHSAEQSNNLQVQDVECYFCKANYFPWNVKNGFVCIREADYLKIEGISGQEQIDHCNKYDADLNCIQCKEGYFLQVEPESVSCVSDCGSGFQRQLTVIENSNTGFRAVNANQCVQEDAQCASYGAKSFSAYSSIQGPQTNLQNQEAANRVCLQCEGANLPTLSSDFSVSFMSNANIASDSFSNLVLDPFATSPEVQCRSPFQVNGVTSQSEVSNCLYYSNTSLSDNNYIHCITCDIGFYGVVKKQTLDDGSTEVDYIDSCSQFDKCDLNSVYYNLPPVLQTSSSCHKCNDNTIPFVPLRVNQTSYAVEGLAPYDLSDIDFQDVAEGNEQYSINCLNPFSPSYFGDATKFTTFPEHCGLGVINLSHSDGNSTDSVMEASLETLTPNLNLAIFCGACLPSYKPTFLHYSVEHIVVKCSPIDNCGSNNQVYFNACSECSSGYTFLYDDQTQAVDHTQCIQHSSSNCYAALARSNSKDGFCRICKKGFVLNRDQFCEELTAARCTTSLGSVIWNGYVTGLVLNYMQFALPQGNGCNSCSSGFVSLERVGNTMVCSVSPYITQNASSFDLQSDQQTKSSYIKNCEGYTLNFDAGEQTEGALQCMQCSSANILNQNGTNCLSTVPNCVIASSTNDEQCAECEEGYALINDTCQAGNIANCASYETKLSNNTIKCKACNPGYYSDSNKTLCKLGIVPNCRVYIENNSKQCSECESGYAKISKEVDVCYPIEPQLNCLSATIESKNDEVMCSDCKLPNQILVAPNRNQGSTENQTICMRHNLVDNCEQYDIAEDISSSSFLCKQCKSGYYLKDYNCKKRAVLPPACSVYEVEEDKCAQCASGHYLINSGKECEAYPTGIIGCRIFTNQVTCHACKANRFLSNNQCIEVAAESQIDNCLYYSSSTTCSECTSGYVLNSGLCSQANAQNCETYTSVDACATCKANYGLKTENGKTNCVTVNKANCISFEPFDDFKCLKCNPNYFPNEDGECQIANPLILGCINYKTNDECE